MANNQNFGSNLFSSYLENFFYEELRTIYATEDLICKRLPTIQVISGSPRLRMALEEQVRIASMHISRLDELFDILSIDKGEKKTDGINSLLEEAEATDTISSGSVARDIAIILSVRKILHYGIASYGGLIHLTKALQLPKAAEILDEILSEKKETDKLFTSIAETIINTNQET